MQTNKQKNRQLAIKLKSKTNSDFINQIKSTVEKKKWQILYAPIERLWSDTVRARKRVIRAKSTRNQFEQFK